MLNPLLKRLGRSQQRRKVLVERLTEPLHINIASAFVALFGGFRSKVDFDLVIRPQYAFPILRAADLAREWGYDKLTLLEFGVASGTGLLNICHIAERVTRETGVQFRIVGFDTGAGMPPPVDYRDLPEIYQEGDYPMDVERLKAALPANCELVLGPVAETLPEFLKTVTADAPIGFASIDVDYYSSAKESLEIFRAAPEKYLPLVPIYLDDIGDITINPWVGEALAVNEFNTENTLRKISPWTMLRARRICKNAKWIEHIFGVHVLDHRIRTPKGRIAPRKTIDNEFIGLSYTARAA